MMDNEENIARNKTFYDYLCMLTLNSDKSIPLFI